MRKKLHFKSKKGYMKWEAYGHIHNVFKEKTQPEILIRGHVHRVKHVRKKRA